MKQLIPALALALCGLLLFVACGGGAQSASSSEVTMVETGGGPPAPLGGSSAAESDTPPASCSEAQSTPAGNDDSAPSTSTDGNDSDTLQSVTGIIDDAGMGKYYVELENGVVVPFDYTNADISGITEFMPGSPITIYYTGELNGADPSGITVVRMETPK